MVRRNSSDQFFEEAFCLDGALMTTSLNCFAGRDLMRNADKYVRIISLRSKDDAVFNQTCSVKDMKKLFLAGKNGNKKTNNNRSAIRLSIYCKNWNTGMTVMIPLQSKKPISLTRKENEKSKKIALFDSEDSSDLDLDKSP